MTRDLDRVPVSQASPLELLRMVWRLWGARRENPLVAAGRPWKRGPAVRVAWLLALAAPWLGVAGLGYMMYAHVQRPWAIVPVLTPLDWLNLASPSYLGALVILGVLGPMVVPYFSFRPQQAAHLDELRVTALTNREVAFGSVYWGLWTFAAMAAAPVMAWLALFGWSIPWLMGFDPLHSPRLVAISPLFAFLAVPVVALASAQFAWRSGAPRALAGLRRATGALLPFLAIYVCLHAALSAAGFLAELSGYPPMLWREARVVEVQAPPGYQHQWSSQSTFQVRSVPAYGFLWLHALMAPLAAMVLLGAARRLCAYAGEWYFSRIEESVLLESHWLNSLWSEGAQVPVRPRWLEGIAIGVAVVALASAASLELRHLTRHEFSPAGQGSFARAHFLAGDTVSVEAPQGGLTDLRVEVFAGGANPRVPPEPVATYPMAPRPGGSAAVAFEMPHVHRAARIEVSGIATLSSAAGRPGHEATIITRTRISGPLTTRKDGASAYLGTRWEAWLARAASPTGLAAMAYIALLVALRGFGADRPLVPGSVGALAWLLVRAALAVAAAELAVAAVEVLRSEQPSLQGRLLQAERGIGTFSGPLAFVLACLFASLVALAASRKPQRVLAWCLGAAGVSILLSQALVTHAAGPSVPFRPAGAVAFGPLLALAVALPLSGMLDGAFQRLHDLTQRERDGRGRLA